jgi:hypothetical protein
VLDNSGNGSIQASDVDGGSFDNCSRVTLAISNNRFTCANVGSNTVVLTVTDEAGNTSTCNATVIVVDNTAPSVICRNATVYLDASGNATVSAAAVTAYASDACGIQGSSVSPSSFTCANKGFNTVTLTVTDNNGNSSTCTATVTVRDNVAPVVICKNATVTLSGGTASITPASINNGSYDNCGTVTLTASPTTFTCANIGTNSVVLKAIDAAGNFTTCTATVTVVGQIPTCTASASYSTIYIGYGQATSTLNVNAAGTGPFTYAWTPAAGLSCTNCKNPVFTPTAGGNFTFTVTVTNSNGCTSTCNVTVCVKDIRVPGTNGKKVYVCHLPPGNPANSQSLEISVNAVSAHVPNHGGDFLGRCDQVCGTAKDDDGSDAALLIAEEGDPFELLLYPNPFSSQFHLNVESASNDLVDIRMFTITGQLTLQQHGVEPNTDIMLGDNLAAGMYLVEVKQGDFTKVVRMTKGN